MGGGTGGYVTITLQTLLSETDTNGDLHRVSELHFRGAPVPPERGVPAGLDTLPALRPASPPVGKVGLGIAPGEVKAFKLYARMDDDTFIDMGAGSRTDSNPRNPDAEITKELVDAFGGAWTGYAVALGPTGGRFRLVADLTLHFEPGQDSAGNATEKPFRVIPVVMAFGTDEFAKHYLLTVVVAQKPGVNPATKTIGDNVDTVITQPYQ